ncbi:ferric uptake regulation protein [Actinobacillus equuli]|nr:ferric uptake regulation protein [Actinobacillus equuli]
MSEENTKLLKSVGLKVTEPRLTILALMQQHRDQMQHFSAEDIYKLLLEQGSDIGLATVYRVLNQFEEVGIYFAITLMRTKRYSSLT